MPSMPSSVRMRTRISFALGTMKCDTQCGRPVSGARRMWTWREVIFMEGECTRIAALCADQADARDLRRDPESHRRSPIPRAAAGVDPQAAQAIQPPGERLPPAHQKIPRPELAAVRMPGELQQPFTAGLNR